MRVTKNLHDAQRPAPKNGLHARGRFNSGALSAEKSVRKSGRKLSYGSAAGPQHGNLPLRVFVDQVPLFERSQESGANQRGLAASRSTDYSKEVNAPQPFQQFIGFMVPAEENVGFVDVKRT
jgi:hypothetical protein